MGLSEDLVSQFVKVTNDGKSKSKEATVYGTTRIIDDKVYVKIDGADNDQLTPVETTVDVKEDERVSILIKDHTATITGNTSSPSARTEDVQELSGKVSDVVANSVTTEQLTATNANIENLQAENAEIKNLVAEKATITDLTATNAEIENLKADYAEIEKAIITEADISVLIAEDATIQRLDAEDAAIRTLVAETATIANANVGRLDATDASIGNLEADVGKIDTLIFGSASGNTIQTEFSNSVIAQVGDAQIKDAMIENVSAGKITTGEIITNNVNVRSDDSSLVIKDATMQISDENETVRVQIGKDASNDYSINVWDEEGNLMFSKGGITDSAIKDAIIRNDMVADDANISGGKLDIESLFETMNDSEYTLKTSKIFYDDEDQTLDVVFKALSEKTDGLNETVNSQGTALSIVQGQISSKIWEQDITTAVDEAVGNIEIGGRNLIKDSETERTIVSTFTNVLDNVTLVAGKSLSSGEYKDYGYTTLSSCEEYIPVSNNAIIRMKDVFLNGTVANVKVEVYDSDYVFLREFKATGTANSYYWDKLETTEEGHVTAFQFKKMTNLAYMRFCFRTEDIGKNPVITINDEISYGDVVAYITDYGKTVLPAEQPVCISFDAYADSDSSIAVCIQNNSDKTSPIQVIPVTTTKKRYSIRTSPSVSDSVTVSFCVTTGDTGYVSGTNIYVSKIKLELGDVATDWTPAPEDSESAIETLTTKYNSFEQTIDGINSIVASHTTEISKKADSSTVTATNDKVAELEQSLEGFKTTVRNTYTTEDEVSSSISAAESRIEQSASSVALSVAQTTVSSALDDYYTAEEVEAKIEASAEGITSTVSSKVNEALADSDLNTRLIAAETKISQTDTKIQSQAKEITSHGTKISTLEQTSEGFTTRLTNTEAAASEASKTATNYLDFSNNGLVVGNHTSTLRGNVKVGQIQQTTNGTNTNVYGVDVRNGTTSLATFGPSKIELGKNSKSSDIELCGGSSIVSAKDHGSAFTDGFNVDSSNVSLWAMSPTKNNMWAYVCARNNSSESFAQLQARYSNTNAARVQTRTSVSGTQSLVLIEAQNDDDYVSSITIAADKEYKGQQITAKWSGDYYTSGSGPIRPWNVNLWDTSQGALSGAEMNKDQIAYLRDKISNQPTGIVLVFSDSDDAYVTTFYKSFFIPKIVVADNKTFNFHASWVASASAGVFGFKNLYISDTSIKGYATSASPNNFDSSVRLLQIYGV